MFFAPQSIINFINISVEVQTVRDKLSVLKEYFGHDSFRKGQDRITDSLLGGRDVLGIMPTGAGKSICYQVPALMFDGITIVVSPLVVTTGFDRPNLFFSVMQPKNKSIALMKLIKERKNESGIVYCSTRKASRKCANCFKKTDLPLPATTRGLMKMNAGATRTILSMTARR